MQLISHFVTVVNASASATGSGGCLGKGVGDEEKTKKNLHHGALDSGTRLQVFDLPSARAAQSESLPVPEKTGGLWQGAQSWVKGGREISSQGPDPRVAAASGGSKQNEH